MILSAAIRRLAAAVAATAGLVIFFRMWVGPFRILLPVQTPLNPEGFFGIAILLLVFLPRPLAAAQNTNRLPAALAAAAGLVAILSYLPTLPNYFLSDDFILVSRAATWTAGDLYTAFITPGGDGFFRPIGTLSLAFDSRWAGTNPVLWHASGLAMHAINCALVALLAVRLGASRAMGFLAGALFAIHAVNPESVVWIASRFDLLATLFTLASLLLFAAAEERSGPPAHIFRAAALLCMILGLLTKESAYVCPLLLVICAVPRWKSPKAAVRVLAPFFIAAAAVFAYRFSLFHGIGGYVVAGTGRPQALSLGIATTLKAVFIRLWAALYFPINWSSQPSRWLAVTCAAYMVCLLWLGIYKRRTSGVWRPLAFILVSILPPLHLLSIGGDLGNARILYLPAAGFCALLALAIDGLSGRAKIAVAVGIAVFQIGVLRHNLHLWSSVATTVKDACTVAAGAAGGSNRLLVSGLPQDIGGVPAFANGFPSCVAMMAGRAVEIVPPTSTNAADIVVLTWDPISGTLRRK